jgi:hypothetical protein
MEAGKERIDLAKKFVDEEGGYLGGLTVYHHLHCLNSLRQTLTVGSYNASFEVPPLWHSGQFDGP